jgi:hypothetical protein
MLIIKKYEGFLSNLFKKNKIKKDDVIEVFTYFIDDERIKTSLEKNTKFHQSSIDLVEIYNPIDSIAFDVAQIIHNELNNYFYYNLFIYNNITFVRIEYYTNVISSEEVLDMVKSTHDRLFSMGAKNSFFLPHSNGVKKNISFDKLKYYLDKQSKDNNYCVNIYFKINNIKE